MRFSSHVCRQVVQGQRHPHPVFMLPRSFKSKQPLDLMRTKALIKPPHPVSNIRPLLLQSVFSENVDASPKQPSSHHPYSLSELALPSASVDLPPHLLRLRQQLAAQDVAFRLLVNRLERESHQFWASINARFTTEKKEALARGQDEDTFDRQWLTRHEAEYRRFHANFLKGQYRALWPAFEAKYRQWQWRWACWRAGVPHGLR